MRLFACWSVPPGLLIAVFWFPTATVTAQDVAHQDAYGQRVVPLLEQYCVGCHNAEVAEAGVILDRFANQDAALADTRTWLRVRDVLEGRVMPPPDEPQPTASELDQIVAWVENDCLLAASDAGGGVPPVVIRRLNRQEYDNTIRDLLGLDLHLADAFPPDDIGFGFDNVGSALNISPIHVEKYLDAAELALDRAILLPDAEPLPPIELIGLVTYPLPPDQPVEFAHTLQPGRYVADFSLVRVGIAESVAPPRLVVGLGKDRRTVDAVRVQDETVVYRLWLNVAEGDHLVQIALAPTSGPPTDPAANPEAIAANVSGDQRYGTERGLHVDSLVVKGPVTLPDDQIPPAHRQILVEPPGPGDDGRLHAARAVVTRFAARALRRPATPDEVDRILAIFRLANDRGESFERAIQVALTTVLASSRFLFLVEPDEAAADRPLTEFELASRLSYFLWSSMPDEKLFDQARAGTLRQNLRAEVVRLVNDAKADAFVANFAGQWLQLRKLGGVTPDLDLFPDFDDSLRDSMRVETERYFAGILRENRSVLELLDSDYTYLNDRLAAHYGITGISGPEWRKVSLADRRRGGVLTQASVLTLTSNPNRTSPVKRGQWVLQQILGTPPPPPPPDVAKLDESPQAGQSASLRERMEIHRTDPKCASCHLQMDALGFSLENFDAVGRWRTLDGVFPVEPAGELPGGRPFADIRELKKLLGSSASKKFAKTLIENMLTYALGRGLEPSDLRTVETIRQRLAADNYHAHDILFGIVASPAFQNRGAAR